MYACYLSALGQGDDETCNVNLSCMGFNDVCICALS